jgi:GDPmannose 4,6-dehydratase
MKKAIITGISGQDGHYLSDVLQRKNYTILGTTRKRGDDRTESLSDSGISIVETDYSEQHIETIIKAFEPDEVYHFAGQTFVGKSWLIPDETLSSALITSRLLHVLSQEMPRTKFFHASSSEIYAPKNGRLAEVDPKEPTNPYGCAKLLSHNMVRAYRRTFGLFAVNGILFNHESTLRQNDFFSKKLVSGIADILEGKSSQLKLGNLDITRDWGSSEDYMSAVFQSMQTETPEDFNICTGVGVTVREIVEAAFEAVNLSSRDHVVLETGLVRTKEAAFVVGDPTKIQNVLGWRATARIPDVVRKMLSDELHRRGINESV